MPGDYLPPTQYNDRGDPYNAYGFTPQGDPIMDRYDALGNRLGYELGYTAQGDPYYHEHTARGDQIFRPLDPTYYGPNHVFWETDEGYDSGYFEGEEDAYDDVDDEEVSGEPKVSSEALGRLKEAIAKRLVELEWEEYYTAAIANFPEAQVAKERTLSHEDKYKWLKANRERYCGDLVTAEKDLKIIELRCKLTEVPVSDTYTGARYMQVGQIESGERFYLPLSYIEWKRRHENFGTDPYFADYLVSERYDQYIFHIVELNGREE